MGEAGSEIIGQFTLADEIERFQPGDGAAGRRAKTLIKNEELRVVLVTMRDGATLQEHTAPGPITIHALSGSFVVSVGDEERELPTGALIAITAGTPHAVTATAAGAFLLTIGWPGGTSARMPEQIS